MGCRVPDAGCRVQGVLDANIFVLGGATQKLRDPRCTRRLLAGIHPPRQAQGSLHVHAMGWGSGITLTLLLQVEVLRSKIDECQVSGSRVLGFSGSRVLGFSGTRVSGFRLLNCEVRLQVLGSELMN